MKKIAAILGLIFLTGFSYAQQDPQFTQYMYNTITINPAYAGNYHGMRIFLLNRSQWVGLEGAPVTTNLSISSPINDNLGVGVTIMNDKIGPSDENNIAVDFSYTIATSEKYKLSFGLKASANLLNIDFNKLSQYNNGDFSFETNIENKLSPNIGAGIYLYSDKTYIGISAPNLLETRHFDRYANTGATSYVAQERIHFFLIMGQVFDLGPYLKFKPALLSKFVQGAPLQIDMSANFLINEKFTLGASYKSSKTFGALVGFQASDSWFIGYGYDLETTRLARYNSGSHEIFLQYDLFNKYGKTISPRFF